ncbi:hypothetical protein FGB62_165g019 [Gracilaria domingensis]|nr:hypothetical protein FGB62_165g019 [Gracilaria domingensis]
MWPKAWCRMGIALIDAERFVEAKEVLEKGYRLCPDSEEVEVLYERALQLYADFESFSVRAFSRGTKLLQQMDFHAAITAFTAAIKACDSENRFPTKKMYAGRCEAYYNISRTETSSDACKKAMELALDGAERFVRNAPKWPRSWVWKGLVLRAMGKLTEAMKELKKGQELRREDDDMNSLIREIDLILLEQEAREAAERRCLNRQTQYLQESCNGCLTKLFIGNNKRFPVFVNIFHSVRLFF